MLGKVLLALFLVLLVGCSDGNDQALEETVFDTQIEALEKAQGVEAELQQSFAKQREALEQE